MSLKKDVKNKVVGGVCAGIAKYLQIDVAFVRLAFVLSTIFYGVGPVIYLVLWMILEEESAA